MVRKQGKGEPVILYISCLEALFKRLSHQVAETIKIKYIRIGLQQDFRDRLALIEIDSVCALGSLCKKLEESRVMTSSSTHHNKIMSNSN